ncbi:hypothetical protein AB3S75_033203 [Citrus x aurantiifolia]
MASSNSVKLVNMNTVNQTPQISNFSTPVKLDRQNFMIWKSQVLPSILGNNLESLINGAKLVPTKFLVQVEEDQIVTTVENPEYIKWLRQDQFLLSWLLSTMTESVLSIVVQYTTSFEVWNALETLFASQSKARILQLKMQLQTTKKNAMTMSDYVNKMKNLADSLAMAGKYVTEDDLISYILAGLGTKYDPVVVNITARIDDFISA